VSKSYVVTGASTGIGRACVAELARGGHHVWAAVRSDTDAEKLRAEHGDAVSVLRLDLTDDGSVRAAGETVRAAGPLHGLVNNAGVAVPGPLEYLPIANFRHQVEVNLTGQLLVTQAMLPALRQARERDGYARIVMIGSIGGRLGSPMLGPYHATKFGLVGLTDSLRAELAPFGIRVILIEPGSVATPIWDRGRRAAEDIVAAMSPEAKRYAGQISAARTNAERTAKRGIPPERAARAIVRALTTPNPGPRQLVGTDARVAATLVRLLPYRLLYRLTRSRVT
jgi:NAD(P)-dependent dehydrogenase (short-subunit alcohol dehydrogenase family)